MHGGPLPTGSLTDAPAPVCSPFACSRGWQHCWESSSICEGCASEANKAEAAHASALRCVAVMCCELTCVSSELAEEALCN